MVQESVGFLQALELYNTAVGPAQAVGLHQVYGHPILLRTPLLDQTEPLTVPYEVLYMRVSANL